MGNTLLAFHSGSSPSTRTWNRLVRFDYVVVVLQSRSAANICFLPNASIGIFFMSFDTVLIRVIVARTVLSPAQKIGGFYLCTMRAASKHIATDAIRAFLLLSCMKFKDRHYSLFDRVCDSAPDGSSPQDYALLFKQWRTISKLLLFTLHSCETIFWTSS